MKKKTQNEKRGTTMSLLGADALIKHLQMYEENISYKRAYELLIGTLPNGRWLNRVHAKVAAEAASTAGTTMQRGLAVRGDAFVVNADGEHKDQPSNDHFSNKSYDRPIWQTAFAGRSLCSHGDYLITRGTPPRKV